MQDRQYNDTKRDPCRDSRAGGGGVLKPPNFKQKIKIEN